jgi:hypothetical protein
MSGTNNMPNLNESVKSKGAVIFATNTRETDYVAIAEQNARLVQHFLGLPTTIVSATDTGTNQRFSSDAGRFVEWRNFGRHEAYEASPYDETIILDADYLILDNSLLQLFECPFDYLLFNKNHTIDGTYEANTMGPHSLPLVWATAVLFRRGEKTQMFFELVARIKRNYDYYRLLYNVREGNYRNDYAFAIAHYILSGYRVARNQFAPHMITTFAGAIRSMELRDGHVVVRSDQAYVLPQQSLHVMSKQYLTTPNLKEFVDQCLSTTPPKAS